MKAIELAKKILSNRDFQELLDALRLLNQKNDKRVYNLYADILGDFISLYSYDEFVDFSNELTINETIFIFGFLWMKKHCIQIGGYEEEVQGMINSFAESKVTNIGFTRLALSGTDIFTDFDGEDNFMDYVAQLNQEISSFGKEIIVFFNDTYSACSFCMLILDADIVKTIMSEWDDDTMIIHK